MAHCQQDKKTSPRREVTSETISSARALHSSRERIRSGTRLDRFVWASRHTASDFHDLEFTFAGAYSV